MQLLCSDQPEETLDKHTLHFLIYLEMRTRHAVKSKCQFSVHRSSRLTFTGSSRPVAGEEGREWSWRGTELAQAGPGPDLRLHGASSPWRLRGAPNKN